jgi:hypothetical protein
MKCDTCGRHMHAVKTDFDYVTRTGQVVYSCPVEFWPPGFGMEGMVHHSMATKQYGEKEFNKILKEV